MIARKCRCLHNSVAKFQVIVGQRNDDCQEIQIITYNSEMEYKLMGFSFLDAAAGFEHRHSAIQLESY